MNPWKKMSYLGVTDEMPIYKQKSTILYNQIIRMLFLFFIVGTFITYYAGLTFVPIAFIIVSPLLAGTMYLNYKGKVQVSIIIVSTFLPVLFMFLSIYSKLNGEGQSLYLYFVPRLIIIMFGFLPAALIGLSNQRKAFLGMLTSIILFLGYDFIHHLFGIYVADLPYIKNHFLLFQGATTGVFFFLVVLVFFLQNINNIYEKLVIDQRDELIEKNEEITSQKEEITAQRDEIEEQRDFALKQKQEITDSINYAKIIQTAVLPEKETISNALPEHFILFKPRDIVSGDFYWFKQIKNHAVIVAADCTGHGVPGAFMSMLGISFLNEIVSKSRFDSAGEILNRLRHKVKVSLKQKGEKSESKDGMDIALCIIDLEFNIVQYAGAYNPLLIIRKNKAEAELIEVKANRQPIAIHIKEEDFKTNEIQLEKGDTFYIFSDGYVDQFGGEKGQKFKTKRFKELLLTINNKPIPEQKEILENTLLEWKGNNEQVDDILVIGVKV